jgi:hypothetical protein
MDTRNVNPRWILGSLQACLTKEEVGRRGGVENIVVKKVETRRELLEELK